MHTHSKVMVGKARLRLIPSNVRTEPSSTELSSAMYVFAFECVDLPMNSKIKPQFFLLNLEVAQCILQFSGHSELCLESLTGLKIT